VKLVGHAVPIDKLRQRFPRTQIAIGMASKVADLTLMFDNSRDSTQAFSLALVRTPNESIYDCRDQAFVQDQALIAIASKWLNIVDPPRTA
jgi:hypothetical protein